MKKEETAKQIAEFLIGFLAGLAAFMATIFLEGFLAIFTQAFLYLSKGSLLALLFLLIPAGIEEAVKISLSWNLWKRFNTVATIIGLGLGVGFSEALISQGTFTWAILSSGLLYLHLIFLFSGFLFAQYMAKGNNRKMILWWLLTSILLHWGYNAFQFTS